MSARFGAMRPLGLLITATVLAVSTSAARGAPVASALEDVDADGRPDVIELDPDGTLRVGSRPLKVAPDAAGGRIRFTRARGKPVVVVEVTRRSGREAVIVDVEAKALREAGRTPLGGVGLDEDYQVEVDVQPSGVYRYQVRPRVRRCDGKTAYLYADGWTGTKFARLSKVPSGVEQATTLTARAEPTAAPLPALYQARAASHQVGAPDAGGLGIPHELDDGRPETTWTEELAGSAGEGQFFTFEPRIATAHARYVRVTGARGFNRPRQLAIVAGRDAWRVELPDDPLATHLVELPRDVPGCVTVILESTWGPERGITAIAELAVYTEAERATGAESVLAQLIADGGDGVIAATAALARRGAAAVRAIETIGSTSKDPASRRRLVSALIRIPDRAAGPVLQRAVTERWVRDEALGEVITALAALQLWPSLQAIVKDQQLDEITRVRAATLLGDPPENGPMLVELAGVGPHSVRRAVIHRLAASSTDDLLRVAGSAGRPAAAGDVWAALSRRARQQPDTRAAIMAAMLEALPGAADYERRYRLVDGIAASGNAAAMVTLNTWLRALPDDASSAALRQVAALAIASAPRADAAPLLVALAENRDPGVRLAVLGALTTATTDRTGPWVSPQGQDGFDRIAITALGTDRWPEVRRRAANVLASRCERPGPAAALEAAVVRDAELPVRADALAALVQCRSAGVSALLAKLWDDADAPLEIRTQAISLAIVLGDRALGETLVKRFAKWRGAAIESAQAVALAQSAAIAIARLDARGAAPALVAALEDEAFPEIVTAAALALGAMGPRCPATARTRLASLATGDDRVAPIAKRAAAQCGR